MHMVCWLFMARQWEGVVCPIDPCYFWAPLGMTPREDIDSSLNASLGSGEMAELRLEVLCLHWDMWYPADTCIFFQAWACVLLGVSYFASQKERPWEGLRHQLSLCHLGCQVRWGDGSFVREARPSYSLALCRAFTHDPAAPWRL